MINLLSPDQKRDVRAARANVMLMHYCIMLAILGALIATVYAAGFWLVNNEEKTVDSKLASQLGRTRVYASVEKRADSFRSDLSVAKSILSKETSYSDFLLTLARNVPTGTILTNLAIGSASSASSSSSKKQADITISARATSYDKILELKNSLEQSPLFENVNIVSATTQESSATVGAEAKYSYSAVLNVKLSTQQTGDGA